MPGGPVLLYRACMCSYGPSQCINLASFTDSYVRPFLFSSSTAFTMRAVQRWTHDLSLLHLHGQYIPLMWQCSNERNGSYCTFLLKNKGWFWQCSTKIKKHHGFLFLKKKRNVRITWICEAIQPMASQRYSICLYFLKLEPVYFRSVSTCHNRRYVPHHKQENRRRNGTVLFQNTCRNDLGKPNLTEAIASSWQNGS